MLNEANPLEKPVCHIPYSLLRHTFTRGGVAEFLREWMVLPPIEEREGLEIPDFTHILIFISKVHSKVLVLPVIKENAALATIGSAVPAPIREKQDDTYSLVLKTAKRQDVYNFFKRASKGDLSAKDHTI